jgi:hypothetical protein
LQKLLLLATEIQAALQSPEKGQNAAQRADPNRKDHLISTY